jgi:hypothetical protein
MLLAAPSCHDAPTASDRDRLAPPLSATRDASPGTVQGPVHIPIAETNTVGWGTLPWTGTGMTVPPYIAGEVQGIADVVFLLNAQRALVPVFH